MSRMKGKKDGSVLMTEGVIWKQLVIFSIPLLIGNLFQQLYNTVDSIVVGQFIGSEALAAVGSSTPLINLIIGMFMGIAVGSGVIISQYYGAKSEDKMGWAVHTSIALSIIGGILLSVVGIVFSPSILRLMKTPPEVLDTFSGFAVQSVIQYGGRYPAGGGRLQAASYIPVHFFCYQYCP